MTFMITTITEVTLSLSRWGELSILIKATIILVIGLTILRLSRRARASVRHLLMATSFAMLLALPLIMVIAPAVAIRVPVPQAGESAMDSRAATPLDVPRPLTSGNLGSRTTESGYWSAPSWMTIIRLGWIAGAIFLLASLAVDLRRCRLIRRDGSPWPERRDFARSLAAECGVRRPVEVLLYEELPAPLTYGMRRPTIALPLEAREWSEADLRRALVHELEHVRRGDWATQLIARVTCAFYWFHPLVWVAWRQISLEAERACDDAVVQSADCADYAEQLVLLARRLSKAYRQPALGMANRSELSRRVSALLNSGQRRGRAGLLAVVGAMIVASLVTLSIAPVRLVARSRSHAAAAAQE